MQYVSTRGQTPPMSFQDAVVTGLAPDGGLLLPAELLRAAVAQLCTLKEPKPAPPSLVLFMDIRGGERGTGTLWQTNTVPS